MVSEANCGILCKYSVIWSEYSDIWGNYSDIYIYICIYTFPTEEYPNELLIPEGVCKIFLATPSLLKKVFFLLL